MPRFFVGILLTDEIETYYKKITQEISEKFDLINLGERVASHITVKGPFEISHMNEFEKTLEQITANEKTTSFSVKGFEVFRRSPNDHGSTIFLNIESNKIFQKKLEEIVDALTPFGEDTRDLPRPYVPHISIARYVPEDVIEEVLQFLTQFPTPQCDTVFDNLTLFKYRPGGWDTYKTFHI